MMNKNSEKLDLSKKSAGDAAAEYVKNNMVVGLGTGSTVKYTIKKLGERIRNENLNIIGIPTSIDTEKLAKKEGILLSTLDEHPIIDLDIDGADECDKNFNLIKGGGGAHTREKIVAVASKKFIVVADSSKKVEKLGAFALPVEVLKSDVEFVKNELIKLGGKPALRKKEGKDIIVTDNGNYILDTKFEINNPLEMELKLNSIPGVVDNGLFAVRKPEIVIFADGCEIEILEK